MTETLRHRGPDDGGVWIDPETGVGLGSRRLAILDLSSEGHQPMLSESGRYVVAHNGEIYNFEALRGELEGLGCCFRGHSDTEVLLAAVSRWGVERALDRFNGMFAFSLWDREDRVLYLARDRVGEKPLYYGENGGVFMFASELKALRAHPSFKGEIDRRALGLFAAHSYVPAPYSIYEGIFKLPPGSLLRVVAKAPREISPVRYWSAHAIAEAGVVQPFAGGEDECLAQLDDLLREAVRLRMVADVPLGAFLSGGIDSSTIVALMQAQSSRPVKTFTIGFHESEYDEAEDARAVAHHLGTDHSELYVGPEEALAVIPKLPFLYDEPFADSSQIPTFLVSAFARRHVTVSLSGDGGDELFGGYSRYFLGETAWTKAGWVPRLLRTAGGRALTAVSPRGWNRVFTRLNPILPRRIRQRTPGDKVHKLGEIFGAEDPEAMYIRLATHWKGDELVLGADGSGDRSVDDSGLWGNGVHFVASMMYEDLVHYLPDDILTKVDRATMGVSLEARVPFLDHRVVEFAWRLPVSAKVGGGRGKLPLRKLLGRYLPQHLIERPKQGFSLPLGDWLRGPLRGWAEDLLDEGLLLRQGFLNPRAVRVRWREHLAGQRNWQHHLWDVLMFQTWLEQARNPRQGVFH